MIKSNDILFIDGNCIFCNRIVLWINKKEKLNHINFSTLQSKYIQNLREELIIENIPESVVFYRDKKLYYKTDVLLLLLKDLGGIYFIFTILFKMIPRAWLNWLYDRFSAKRHHWFGQTTPFCILPDNGISNRIIA